jgi:CRP-like cAMP-binding protein
MNTANGRILRLVKSDPERQALDSGQVDAVLDAETGTAILLPEARRAMLPARGPIANGLLAALPGEDYHNLLGELEVVTLTAGQVLYEPGDRIRHVYFPNDAHVSLLVVMADRKALEVGMVGQEGMVGIALALGTETSPVRVLVQGSGSALERSPSLQRELHRYAYAKLLQARQTAACNRFHQVEARLARWLLMTRDRVRSDRFHLTHEFLADTLGVRRVGVTNAASSLQRRKLIRYHRGDIRILNRKGLQAASCSCYEIVRNLAS